MKQSKKGSLQFYQLQYFPFWILTIPVIVKTY